MSSHSHSKKPTSKAKKPSTSSAPISSSSTTTSKKRSTPLLPPEESTTTSSSKRAKRSVVGNGKKSLREEELGVGQEIEEDDEASEKGGKGKERDQEEDDEEDEEDEEGGDGGVTRCVCGDDNEEMSSGLMIQCDTCKCWQHGPCVGLWEEKECPNRYFCELCKPALHGPGGLLRKVSRKSSAPAARRATRSPSITTSHKGVSTSTSHSESRSHPKPRESLDSLHSHSHSHVADARSPSHEEPSTSSSSKRKKSLGPPGPPPKKRSTMNSRDAAYDDAIALSILEAGGAARRDKLEGRERSDSDSDEEGEGEEGEGEEEGEKSDEEKEEKGRNAKATARGKGGGTTAKAGTKRTANMGGKGKSNGRSSNARSKSEQSEQTPLVVPKTEPEHDVDEEQEIGEGEEGEIQETGKGKKKRNISPELGRVEKESMVVDAEETEAEKGVVDEDEEMKDVEGEVVRDGVEQVEEEEEAHEVSPAPLPIPTIVAPPTTHHSTSRAKHPNQYTYRPKNGTTAAPSTSTSASTSSRNPRASPLKGRSHAKDDSTLSVPPTTNSKSSSKSSSSGGGGMTKSEKAEREREKKQWASELGIHLGWSMPEHLKHLGYLLPTPTPEPITVPTSASVYAATMQNGGGGGGSIIGGQYNPLQEYEELSSSFRPNSSDQSEGGSSGSGHHFEPPHKVKFPAKRTTMPEMKKRIKSLGEYLDRVRQELGDREKKDEVLRRAIEANGMMKSGQVVGGVEEEMGVSPVGGSQALGTSAISEATLKVMEALGRELVMFQQRFDS